MPIGQVEHGLLRQLLRVIGARASLEDDFLIRVNNMKVTNPAVGGAVDVSLDKLGHFQMVLAESDPPKLSCRVEHRHASLPFDRLHDWATHMRTLVPNEQIGKLSRDLASARPGNEIRLVKALKLESFVPSLIPTGNQIDLR